MWRVREAGDAMDVVITPEHGRVKEIAQVLLKLAAHPNDVQMVSWPAQGFRVSGDLFARFEYFMAGEDSAETESEPEVAEPVKKRPGRPRKIAPDIAEEGK